MAFEDREIFRVLFLDKKNGLLADEVQGVGTVDHAPAYPREVIRRALELSASAIILVHNHPSGDPTPSTQDLRTTQDIIGTCKPLGPHHRQPLWPCFVEGHGVDLALVFEPHPGRS